MKGLGCLWAGSLGVTPAGVTGTLSAGPGAGSTGGVGTPGCGAVTSCDVDGIWSIWVGACEVSMLFLYEVLFWFCK